MKKMHHIFAAPVPQLLKERNLRTASDAYVSLISAARVFIHESEPDGMCTHDREILQQSMLKVTRFVTVSQRLLCRFEVTSWVKLLMCSGDAAVMYA